MAFQINKDKIAKNTVALYIRMGITMLISFFATRVTLQVLGVEDYGLNNLVGGIVAMFSFINSSMGTAVQRFYSIEIGKKDDGKLKRVFSAGLYCHIVVALITFLLTEIFAIFYTEKKYKNMSLILNGTEGTGGRYGYRYGYHYGYGAHYHYGSNANRGGEWLDNS